MMLCVARNDLALGTERIVRANEADDGTALHWHRLLAGHFFEAGSFLRRTMDIPEVQRFIEQLPGERLVDYETLLKTAKRWSRKRLRRGRNRTFHYLDVAAGSGRRLGLIRRLLPRTQSSPGPADLERALGAVGARPVEIRGSRVLAGKRTI